MTIASSDTAVFPDQSSYDRDEGGDRIDGYSWAVIGASATGGGEEFAHPFQLGGDTPEAERTVELTVTDDEGSVDTETRTVRVVRPERRYYVTDHLGSIRVVVDGSPDWVEQRDYYPFGLPMPGRHEKGSPPTQEDFTGHVKDNSTGLHYAGARYYSAAFGRWTTTDPILGGKGAKELLKNKPRLLAMTSYNYVFNNPVQHSVQVGSGFA